MLQINRYNSTMEKKELIKKYYSRESIVKIITSYVLYYQVSLGNNIYETLQDIDETALKIKELNLIIEEKQVLIDIFKIILAHSDESNFDKEFESYLKQHAFTKSLEDFVNKDKDLLNKEFFKKAKQKAILEDRFFTSNMMMQYLHEYTDMHKHYNSKVSEDFALGIQDILINSFN